MKFPCGRSKTWGTLSPESSWSPNHAYAFVGCFWLMRIDQSWHPHSSRIWMSITTSFFFFFSTSRRMYFARINVYVRLLPRWSYSLVSKRTLVTRKLWQTFPPNPSKHNCAKTSHFFGWNYHNSPGPKAGPFFCLTTRYTKKRTMNESLSIFPSSSSQFCSTQYSFSFQH